MATSQRAVETAAQDPFRGFKFRVLIGTGGEQLGFQSVSGLSEETEVVEYREGTDPVTARKLPGMTSYANIVLQRGLSKSTFLLDWRKQVAHSDSPASGLADGVPDFRRTVTIQLFDKGQDLASAPVKSWDVNKAWPAKLELSDLNAGSSDVVIESLELAHEGWVEK